MTIFSAHTLSGGPADLEITVSKEGLVKAVIHEPTYVAPNATHQNVEFDEALMS